MDIKQAGMGIVLILVFWLFQMHYFDGLGTAAWFLGALIFGVVLWLIGKWVMPKPSADQKELWMFTMLFALVLTAVVSFVPASYLGAVFPANFDPTQLTPLLLSIWLIIFGGAMFVTGWEMKWSVTLLVGIVWLFSSIHLALNTGPNSWIHFGLITGLPFVLYGLLAKE